MEEIQPGRSGSASALGNCSAGRSGVTVGEGRAALVTAEDDCPNEPLSDVTHLSPTAILRNIDFVGVLSY